MFSLLVLCWSLAALASPIAQRQASQKITGNLSQRFQTIDGFGIPEAFQRANNTVDLKEPKQTEVLDLLFSTTTGAGFSIVRNGIGSSPGNAKDWMITFAQDPGGSAAPPKYNCDGKDSGQLWFSQQAATRYGVKTFYGDGYTWANNIYSGLTAGNVSAYLWWVGTQDRATNNNNNEKLILVDGQSYQVSKRLWAFAQYSRTVRPGAVRVGTSVGGSGLKTTAFINEDGGRAVNFINTGAASASLSIAGVNGTSVQAWATDNMRDMEALHATIEAGTVTGSVPGRGMVSFVMS